MLLSAGHPALRVRMANSGAELMHAHPPDAHTLTRSASGVRGEEEPQHFSVSDNSSVGLDRDPNKATRGAVVPEATSTRDHSRSLTRITHTPRDTDGLRTEHARRGARGGTSQGRLG